LLTLIFYQTILTINIKGFKHESRLMYTCLSFLGNKKDKILSKNLGFCAWLGFLIGMHEVNLFFSIKTILSF
jgi:hypothetical protein